MVTECRSCIFFIILSMFLSSCSAATSSALTATATDWKNSCAWQENNDLLLSQQLRSSDASGLAQLSSLLPSTNDQDTISIRDAVADLACLRKVFVQSYAGSEFYFQRGIALVDRLDHFATKMLELDSSNGPSSVKISILLDKIFDLHKDAPDAHMFYKRILAGGAGSESEVRRGFPTQAVKALPWEFNKNADGTLTPIDLNFSNLRLKGCKNFATVSSLSKLRTVVGESPKTAYSLVSQVPMTNGEEAICQQADSSEVLISVREIRPRSFDPNESFGFEERADGVIFVRMASFLDAIDEPKLKLVSILSNEDESRPIVFDLRANRGGGNGYAEKVAAALRAVSEPVKLTTMKNKLSRLSVTGFLNTLALMYLDTPASSPDKAPLWGRFKSTRDGLFTWAESTLSADQIIWSSKSSQEEIDPTRQHPYAGRIVLLVDKHCASECESFVELLQDLASVTIVGTPTDGAMHLSNPGTIVLPKSKIIARLGMAVTEYDPAIDAPEMSGHDPAVYLTDDDEDARRDMAIAIAKYGILVQ